MNANRRDFLLSTTAGLVALQNRLAHELEELEFAKDSAIDVDKLRSQFSLDPEVTYLNHASIGAISKQTQSARAQYLQLCEQNPWLYMWGGQWEQPKEQCRKTIANFFGTEPNEIAITHNTTELFNTLAHGLPWQPGDEVLFSSLNHAGASIAFEHAAQQMPFVARKFEFPLERTSELTAERVVEIYKTQVSSATRLLVFPHVDNTIGIRYPVADLVKMARRKGVQYIAVDGAQSAGMFDVQLRKLGIDVYATSGHKWLGAPKGTGIGYVSAAMQKDLRPMWVTWGQKSWAQSARKYEDYGTRNLPEVLAVGDAIQFHKKVNFDVRDRRLNQLRNHIQDALSAIPTLEFKSPRQNQLGAAVICVGLKRGGARSVAKMLFEQHKIVVRPFQSKKLNAIRISPNVYTTLNEVDKAINVLKTI